MQDERLLEILKLEEFENDITVNADNIKEQKNELVADAKKKHLKKDAVLIQFERYMKLLEANK